VIRLALVDDHAILRDGLTQLLAAVDDFEIVGTAADVADAVQLLEAAGEAPDVMLMDLEMPRSGSNATAG
jgi:DNA-binding NarL/FixJ family response regulator